MAHEAEVGGRKRLTLESLWTVQGESRFRDWTAPPRSQQEKRSPEVPEDLISYLRMIHDTPGIAATERDEKYGVLPKKGSQKRKKLRDPGLIEECHVSPGIHGRNFKDVRLTERGMSFLRKLDDKEKLEQYSDFNDRV